MPQVYRTEAPQPSKKTVRSSVSIPKDSHEELLKIAEKNDVSVAWVIRRAVEQYLVAEHPLFPPDQE